jgi:hypothetical protein
MSEPKIVLFDWKESPESVIKELAETINRWSGSERLFITLIDDTEDDSVIAIIDTRKLSQRECHKILDDASGI